MSPSAINQKCIIGCVYSSNTKMSDCMSLYLYIETCRGKFVILGL